LVATLIQLAISRSREYLADETGAKTVKDGNALADALEKIEKNIDVNPLRFGSTATSHLFISNPFRGQNFLSLFMTHPSTKSRAEKLRNMKF
jgi:heat shock protein HtpX